MEIWYRRVYTGLRSRNGQMGASFLVWAYAGGADIRVIGVGPSL